MAVNYGELTLSTTCMAPTTLDRTPWPHHTDSFHWKGKEHSPLTPKSTLLWIPLLQQPLCLSFLK